MVDFTDKSSGVGVEFLLTEDGEILLTEDSEELLTEGDGSTQDTGFTDNQG
jgi:hypothetical protein